MHTLRDSLAGLAAKDLRAVVLRSGLDGAFSAGSDVRDHTRERLTELGLEPTKLLTPSFGARTFTHRHGCESFFFCALWKRR